MNSTVRSYFESEERQKSALEACRNFLGVKGWTVGDRLKLYDLSRLAFNPNASPTAAAIHFRQIYDDLVRVPNCGGWGIARNASGPMWTSDKTFETIRVEFSKFAWDGKVSLLNLSGTTDVLPSLEKMRSFKPVADWPVMAVSKVLHFYNPELFPIYDVEVIWRKVLTRFKAEFKAFCLAHSRPWDFGDTPTFYRNYMAWGKCLLSAGHPRFMEVFKVWLDAQPGANLSKRPYDASRLFATAYEYMIIGAYAISEKIAKAG